MKIDLFNLFKNYENWLGAIYNVLLNLPRFIRLKWENMMLLGYQNRNVELIATLNLLLINSF